uniref:ADAM metallopeptidase domain 8 n=1 Tax=Terrapene triunguis TaxID=2587831 RepID=A0A674IR39_9SAUR
MLFLPGPTLGDNTPAPLQCFPLLPASSYSWELLPQFDHCFYHGHVHGHSDSAASISTCRGLSGFFWADQTVYLIEPLGGDDKGEHAVYRTDHLRMKRGTCGDANVTLEYDHEPKVAAAMKPHHWVGNHPVPLWTRYVELVLVVDNAEVRGTALIQSLFLLQLYQTLNIRVALIGLEVWSYKDKITVSPNPDTTLDNFLHWRETELLQKKKHDNAQLITGIDFQGTTVGLAKKYAMCTRDSGGVNQDHSLNPIGAASTVAHEMGHNLGMSHDEDVDGCSCLAPKTDGGCVMAASVGMIYPKYFSSCSVSDLQKFLSDPRTSCLLNIPKADELYGVPVCGNQFIERGEQCDCGTSKECRDPCCNATTCRLSDGAECAQGECCQQCKVKAAGVLCRASKNSCDLPEHCTGLSAECPEDVFQENGVPCQYGNGYCYNGVCPSHSEHCRTLWGAGNMALCMRSFSSMLTRRCGTLHCLSGNRNPIGGGGVYSLSLGRVTCKVAITVKEESDMVANLVLVPTGTKCGEEMVCYAGRCQDLLIYGAKNCSAKCNGHGVCNHKRECHCEPGWAAPYCERKLSEIASGTTLTRARRAGLGMDLLEETAGLQAVAIWMDRLNQYGCLTLSIPIHWPLVLVPDSRYPGACLSPVLTGKCPHAFPCPLWPAGEKSSFPHGLSNPSPSAEAADQWVNLSWWFLSW